MKLQKCLEKITKEELDEKLNIIMPNLSNEICKMNETEKHQAFIELIPIELFKLTDEDLKELIELINKKKKITENKNLLSSIFVYNIDGKQIVPEEMNEILNDDGFSKMIEEKYKTIISYYIESCGAISKDKLYELCKKTGINSTKTKYNKYLKELDFIIDDDIIYYNEKAQELNFYKFNKNGEYKIFSPEEIIIFKMAIEPYYYNSLKEIFEKYKTPQNISEVLVCLVKDGFDYELLIEEIFKTLNLKLKKKDEKKFYNLINEMYLRFPNWEYNGFSPIQLTEEQTNDINEYIDGYMLINGIIKIDILFDLLKNTHEFDITKKELINIINNSENYKIKKEYIALKDIDRETIDILQIMKERSQKYKIIDDLDEIMYENNEIEQKLSYISDSYNLNEDAKGNIHITLLLGLGEEEIIDEILEDYNLSNKQKKEIQIKIKKLSKDFRKWIYNGFKKTELIVKNNKVGRNEPCPCGSGKKYKKCCGK